MRPLTGEGRKLYIETYGCQMNVNDSEVVLSIMQDAGYRYTEHLDEADVILINTCSVRDNAEQRIFGRLREFKPYKQKKELLIGVIGCMAERLRERLIEQEHLVDIVAGPDAYRDLPRLVRQAGTGVKAVNVLLSQEETYADISPVRLDKNGVSAFISIMRGCNNMCSYCVVPYTRGAERSRNPQTILREARELFEAGYREVTLLGQNVNSYGNDLDLDYHFPDLLEDIDKIPGEYLIRFMSSHPKDATNHLFDVMAKCSHVAKQLHLPFQSGNDRVLKEMNRRYTREKYLEEIRYAKSVMPGLVLTSDVIIGFPGETEAEAMDTVSLVEEVGFDALFTFIYSPRPGTKAASMPDPATRAEKQKWFDRLLEVQNANSARLHAAYVGKTVRVLVDGESDDENFPLASRTEGNRLVRLKGGKELIGQFIDVKVTDSNTWALYGEPV